METVFEYDVLLLISRNPNDPGIPQVIMMFR
jgi:hypothetical protein